MTSLKINIFGSWGLRAARGDLNLWFMETQMGFPPSSSEIMASASEKRKMPVVHFFQQNGRHGLREAPSEWVAGAALVA